MQNQEMKTLDKDLGKSETEWKGDGNGMITRSKSSVES